MRGRHTAALVAAAIIGFGLAASAEDRLGLKVSRTVVRTNESVVVTAVVPPDQENRVIGIQADNGEFLRSTEIEIDGERAPRVFELPLRNLPSGEYHVIAVLVDRQGHRTTVRRTFTVLDMGNGR